MLIQRGLLNYLEPTGIKLWAQAVQSVRCSGLRLAQHQAELSRSRTRGGRGPSESPLHPPPYQPLLTTPKGLFKRLTAGSPELGLGSQSPCVLATQGLWQGREGQAAIARFQATATNRQNEIPAAAAPEASENSGKLAMEARHEWGGGGQGAFGGRRGQGRRLPLAIGARMLLSLP